MSEGYWIATPQGARYVVREEKRADAETIENLIGNLLARIHRDGGHYQAEHGTIEAIKAAELEVVKLRADAEKDAAHSNLIRDIVALCNGYLVKQGDDYALGSDRCAREVLRAILAANKERNGNST